MTKQVEFFEADNTFSLQKIVNKFLKTLHWSSEIDVKYHHSNIHTPESSNNYESWESVYTAMVIYEPHGDSDSVPEGTEGEKEDDGKYKMGPYGAVAKPL